MFECVRFSKRLFFINKRNFISQIKITHSYGLSWCDENNFYKLYIGSETVNFCLMNQSVYGNRRVRTLFIIFFIFILILCGLFKRYMLTFLCWSVRIIFFKLCCEVSEIWNYYGMEWYYLLTPTKIEIRKEIKFSLQIWKYFIVLIDWSQIKPCGMLMWMQIYSMN